jgi:dienelactone hydrolase
MTQPSVKLSRRSLIQSALAAGLCGSCPALAGPTDILSTAIASDGVVGEFHAERGAHARTAVIMLNGSDGGIPPAAAARDLARAGFPTLALAYLQDDQDRPAGVPAASPVPLEIVFRAIEWLKARPEARPNRVVLMGVSRGAELALLVASLRPDIAGVIAYSPSNRIWGAPADRKHGVDWDRSAWSLGGRPLPYQAWKPDFKLPVREWFARAARVDGTEIAVEKIRGPVLLISSTADGEWPASRYADEIVQRLKTRHFPYPVTNLQFADASHLLMGFGPGVTKIAVPNTDYVIDFGGTAEGTERARNLGWAASKRFLASLGGNRSG